MDNPTMQGGKHNLYVTIEAIAYHTRLLWTNFVKNTI